ncbi:Heat shock 70 kDa protein 14 [Platanthera guangdongensis]|uniref:Heat shock 70 kDa protein 14 n=1 Tax=Platanthera guangdongensis TaxID=2320717 RepID=A0ABR2LKZ8_9ASPA
MTDKIYQLQGVKLQDLEDRVTEREVVNLSSCQEVCLEKCSCRAYTFLDVIGCMIWVVDLVDITVFSVGGYDLYLRLAPGEFSQAATRKKNPNDHACGACDLPESDQLNVAFIDVGHASMQVCITGFRKGQLKILAHSYD